MKIRIENLSNIKSILLSEKPMVWYDLENVDGIDFKKNRSIKRMEILNEYDSSDDELPDYILTEYISYYMQAQTEQIEFKLEYKKVEKVISHRDFFKAIAFLISKLYSYYAIVNLSYYIRLFIKENREDVKEFMKKEMSFSDKYSKEIYMYIFREYFE